jgi:Tfp pilus assembly protein PilO
MKLSRKVLLIIEAVILVAALAGLYVVYSRQAGERDALNDRLSVAQTFLSALTTNEQNLEDQLAHAQSSIDAAQAQFPQSVESIEYDNDLFAIADDCNVDITSITASPPTNKKVGAVTYSVSPFVVAVKGSTDNILDFIYAIRTGKDFQLPWSAEVTSVSMDVAGSATISLNIYGYKG